VQEYVITSIPHPRQHFIAKYAEGTPGPAVGNRRRWLMQREGAEGRSTRPEELEKLRGFPWLMGDLTERNLYRGTLEGGQQASYMALIMADNKLTTFPISAWCVLQVAVCWHFGDVLRERLF
jgi:hypothetical protein